MTFPSNADADPDPTTQMPWPGRRNASGSHILKAGGGVRPPARGPLKLDPIKTLVNPVRKRRLTTKDLIFLSISMAGAQIAWTVELGYVCHGFRLLAPYVGFGCLRITECLRTSRADMGRRFCCL